MISVGLSPCKDCPNRFVGCHSTCDNYKQWKKAHLEEKARLDEQRKIDRASVSLYEDIANRKHIKKVENYRKDKRRR